jgi:hypothetical protein
MNVALPSVPSPFARWSRRLAVFSLQVVLVAMVLHRVAVLGTPLTLNLFLAAFALVGVAVLLAVTGLVRIWRDGRTGTWNAVAALVIAAGLAAWPAALWPTFQRLPEIHDISTNTTQPPAFTALAAERRPGANSVAYGGPEVARLQLAFYPDIRPVVVPRPPSEAWDVMTETVRRLGWRIVSEVPPGTRGGAGHLEAVDRTLVLGFFDDVVIRVDGNARDSRIDVRSASRYGRHDLGRNATRIRRLLKEFSTRLDATVTGAERPRGRSSPGAAVPKRVKGAPVAAKGQRPQQGRALRDSQREPSRKARQPSRAADQGRDKRQPRPQ